MCNKLFCWMYNVLHCGSLFPPNRLCLLYKYVSSYFHKYTFQHPHKKIETQCVFKQKPLIFECFYLHILIRHNHIFYCDLSIHAHNVFWPYLFHVFFLFSVTQWVSLAVLTGLYWGCVYRTVCTLPASTHTRTRGRDVVGKRQGINGSEMYYVHAGKYHYKAHCYI